MVQEKPDDGSCKPQAGSTGFDITVTRVFRDLATGAEVQREDFQTRYAAEPVIRCIAATPATPRAAGTGREDAGRLSVPRPGGSRGGSRSRPGAAGVPAVHTEQVSTVLPSGSPARAGDPRHGRTRLGRHAAAGHRPHRRTDDDAEGRQAGGRLASWPAPVRVPLQVLGRTLAKAWHDRILGLSAEAAFWQILSVPPLLIGLLGSLGYLGSLIGAEAVRQIEDELLSASARVLTSDVVDDLVAPTLSDILGSGRLEVVSLGFVLALWAGSSATATFMNTIVIAYDQRDVRGPIRTRLKALWLFIVGMFMAVLTLPLLVLGRGVLVGLLPREWRDTATVLVNAVYWPVVLIGLVLALTSFYHVVLPNRLPWRGTCPAPCSRWPSSSSPPCSCAPTWPTS